MSIFVTPELLSAYASSLRGSTDVQEFANVTSSIYEVEEGSLFVPVRGTRYDGHQFIEAAVEGGAAAALWRNGEPVPDTIPEHFPLFMTDSPEQVCKDLAAYYLQQHTAKVVLVEGDYTAGVMLRMMTAWMKGRKTAVLNERQLESASDAELILSLDTDTEFVFLHIEENEKRRESLAGLLKPEITLICTVEADQTKAHSDAGTIVSTLFPPTPSSSRDDLPEWLAVYAPLIQTAEDSYRRLTGKAHPPASFLRPEVFGFQVMPAVNGGYVLFESEAMEEAELDYSLGWLSHTGSYDRRYLIIDEGFQSDRYHKAVHELFAEHITIAITDVIAVGEKAFWVHDALERAERDDVVSFYYKTHVDAVDKLKEALVGNNLIMYKGANREMIYEILQELNRD
ncbi:Mur ligase domain-containing protein [Alkalicoccus luteus]|uniref:Mur ligase N-terminal catalytic domain-containing protein n=1 Tax=Alkalicoccus luteus TaxID=1237094 RepID=A0A969PNB9_9BACI|nr:Mur ligase domain-containing protein [Alkalicoccus luteus]NJP36448.1 hypothetical protein [Alkalicoccus luteus]